MKKELLAKIRKHALAIAELAEDADDPLTIDYIQTDFDEIEKALDKLYETEDKA
jgi:hypothetical protein